MINEEKLAKTLLSIFEKIDNEKMPTNSLYNRLLGKDFINGFNTGVTSAIIKIMAGLADIGVCVCADDAEDVFVEYNEMNPVVSEENVESEGLTAEEKATFNPFFFNEEMLREIRKKEESDNSNGMLELDKLFKKIKGV